MSSSVSELSLRDIKHKVHEGQEAADERIRRIERQLSDLSRRMADMESILDEQLEVGSQVSMLSHPPGYALCEKLIPA